MNWPSLMSNAANATANTSETKPEPRLRIKEKTVLQRYILHKLLDYADDKPVIFANALLYEELGCLIFEKLLRKRMAKKRDERACAGATTGGDCK